MKCETEHESRPVFDDLNPEMLIEVWELLSKEERPTGSDEKDGYCRDTSAWDY